MLLFRQVLSQFDETGFASDNKLVQVQLKAQWHFSDGRLLCFLKETGPIEGVSPNVSSRAES